MCSHIIIIIIYRYLGYIQTAIVISGAPLSLAKDTRRRTDNAYHERVHDCTTPIKHLTAYMLPDYASLSYCLYVCVCVCGIL